MRKSQRAISVARVGWLRISPEHLACFAARVSIKFIKTNKKPDPASARQNQAIQGTAKAAHDLIVSSQLMRHRE